MFTPSSREQLNFNKWDGDHPFRVNYLNVTFDTCLHYRYGEEDRVRGIQESHSEKELACLDYNHDKTTTIRFFPKKLNTPTPHESFYRFGQGGRPLARKVAGLDERFLWHQHPKPTYHPSSLYPKKHRDPHKRYNHHLWAHILATDKQEIHVATLYEYDKSGNVTCEALLGDLTGERRSNLRLVSRTHIEGDQADTYTTHRTYSDDGFNLLLEETDGITTVQYTYQPGTNLLLSKLTLADERTFLREFFTYDNCAVVTCHICDDGSGTESTDLTDVTVRTITRTTPRYQCPAFGLPEKIEEWYWDPITQEEHHLRTTHYAYTQNGQLAGIARHDPHGPHPPKWARMEYNKCGRLITHVLPEGETTHYTYDQNGNCSEEWTDGIEGTTSYCYNSLNQLIRKTERRYLDWCYEYDIQGNLVCEIDPHGRCTDRSYDALGQVLSETRRPIRQGDGWIRPQVTRTYDPLGCVATETDANGFTTHHLYNVRKQRVHSHYPDGTTEEFRYTLRGDLLRHTTKEGATISYTHDALGITTTYTYDGARRLLATHRGNRHTEFIYDGYNRKTCQREFLPHGYRATHWEYDENDRVVRTWTQDQGQQIVNSTTYEYDPLGRIILERTADERQEIVTKRQYNRLGQLLYEQKGTESTTITYDYNANNDGESVLRIITTDALGGQVEELRDPAGNIDTLTHRSPTGEILSCTHYRYDGQGQRIQETRAHSITQWKYGPMGRLEQLIEGNTRTTTYLYDQYGQQTTVIKPDNTKILTEYDCLQRLVQKSGPDFNDQYTYDPLGQLLSAGNTHLVYDIDGEVIAETLENGLTLSYTYDPLGRPTLLTLPDSSHIQYQWDSLFLREVQRNGYRHQYKAYNQRGQLTQGCLGNGLPYHLQFDPLDRCEQMTSNDFSFLAAYNAVGNCTSLQIDDPCGSLHESFSHDGLHHITKEEGLETHHYAYDSLGNRILCDGVPAHYDPLNQQIAPHLQWDPNGCLAKQNGVTYEYDSLDRLIRVEGATLAVCMTYDYKHRRQSRTLYQRASPDDPLVPIAHLRFLYQGDAEIGAVDDQGRIVELRVLGIGHAGDNGSSVLIELDGQSYFPLHDHRGSVSVLLDHTGAVVESYRYLAFGAHQTTGTLGNPWRFLSKRHDDTTGLVYFGRRYYDPKLARWITPDPLGYKDGPNRYAYCHNRPLTRTDYRGYISFTIEFTWTPGGRRPSNTNKPQRIP